MKTLLLSLVSLTLVGMVFGADEFEKLGKQQTAGALALDKQIAKPGKLFDKDLTWDAKPSTGFAPGDKIDTQAKLEAEIQRMRQRYEPFMADLAPALPVTRQRMELEKFDYRLVSAGGKPVVTNWTAVTIPHYAGPINTAEAHYRTEFVLEPAMLKHDTLFLHFQAVDYITEVFVNDQLAGKHEGLFDGFRFDIKPLVKPGKNTLLVKVFNDAVHMGDFFNTGPGRQFGKKFAACGGPGWDEAGKGWTMCPPGFGIWQRAWIEARPAAFVSDIFVRPFPQENKAEVAVEVAGDARGIEVSYSLYGQNFKQTLAKNHVADGKFIVPMPQFRWWSPDEPWLYQIQIQLKRDGKVIDIAKRQFGMRTFEQSTTSTPKGRFYLNGKEIKLRGANMMGNLMQCVIRKDFNQLRDDILIAKIAHMNFWRMTQQPCQEEVYDYFDRLGLLAQTDMPVFNGYRKDQAAEGLRELKAMVRLVRGHPCDGVITYCNEPDFGKPMMLKQQEHVAMFTQFDQVVRELNPEQVIKWIEGGHIQNEGYFDYHNYAGWYSGMGDNYRQCVPVLSNGWMRACGEFGAEAIDSVELMNKYYPKKWLEKSPDGTWTPARAPRCQCVTTGRGWFGAPTTMEDWVKISRDHQYWVVRMMTESYRRNSKMNSIGVHLLIDAWPAGWMKAIMDCDRHAKPAYFAYREALTPLAAILQADKFYYFSGDKIRVRAWVCNDTAEVPAGATLRYQIELAGKILQTGSAPADVLADNPQFQGNLKFTAPDVTSRQPLTVRLGLFDQFGKLLHDTSVNLDLFPASDKDQKLDHPGGQAQRLLGS